MAAGAVALPEGFEIEKLPAGKGMPLPISFTPGEMIATAQQEAEPGVGAELEKEIARNKNDPKKLAILLAEQKRRADSMIAIPEGFDLETKPARITVADQLYSAQSYKPGAKKLDETVGTAEYILNKAKVGLTAGVGGFVGDIMALLPERPSGFAYDPIRIALRFAQEGQQALTEPGKAKFGTSENIAERLLGYEPGMKAPDEPTHFAGKVAEFAAGGALSLGRTVVKEGIKAAPKIAAELGALSTAVAGGSELGERATDSPWGGLVGSILALPAYASIRKLPVLWTTIKNLVSSDSRSTAAQGIESFLKPVIEAKAERDLAQGLREMGPEKAAANIKETAALQRDINQAIGPTGQQVMTTAGQASGSRRIIDAELEARKASYTANEAAKLQSERNAAAIQSYIRMGDAPAATTIKTAVDRANNEFNAGLEALRAEEAALRARAEKIPQLLPVKRTAEERGLRLTNIGIEEKIREDVIKDKIYNAVAVEANRVNAAFDTSLMEESAARMMANPILKYDATNAPSVVSKIEEVTQGIRDAATKLVLPPGTARPAPSVAFRDIQAMETAVNQDIAAELAMAGPNTGQRIFALKQMKAAIQGAVAESNYPELKKLYSAATSYYRDTYSPRFNTGVNAKLWMRNNFGENKILDEKVLDEYAKNKNNVNRFVSLFGKNPEALAVMQDHVFDRFKTAVVKDGVIEPKAYAAFLRKNADMLSVLQKSGLPTVGKMDDAVAMTQKFSERADHLVRNEKALAESELYKALQTKDINAIAGTALRSPEAMGRLTNSLGEQGSRALASKVLREVQEKITYPLDSGRVGLNSQAMGDWLAINDKPLRILYRAAYGPQEGKAHLDRLQKAYRMMAIQDRVVLPRNVTEPTSVGTDPLKASTGVAITSLWSMMRAVGRGVNSPQNVALVLGGQSSSFYLNKAYNNLMQSIATNPESSKYLLKLVETGGKAAPTKKEMLERAKAMAGLLSQAGYFWAGGRYYGPSLKSMAPGAIAMAEEQQREQETTNAEGN